MRVTSSSETDIYSSVTSAIGSLKGPLHGGANVRVLEMMENMKAHVKDWTSEKRLKSIFLRSLIKKQMIFQVRYMELAMLFILYLIPGLQF